MKLNKIFKNAFLLFAACLVLSACATKKEATIGKIEGQMQGDVYTGTDTVEYLASGVKDRVFFATNESVLTTAARETLRKQAAWLRKRCPCAHCNEERKNPKPTDLLPVISASEAQPLTIDDVKPLGNYAYTISFSDGHDTGIYEISVLRELGESL